MLDNSAVTTRLMSAELDRVPAVDGASFLAAALPYDDERLSLLLVVPDAGTFTAFEATLDQAKLDAIVASLVSQAVYLSMPSFKIETGQRLVGLLQSLGMT